MLSFITTTVFITRVSIIALKDFLFGTVWGKLPWLGFISGVISFGIGAAATSSFQEAVTIGKSIFEAGAHALHTFKYGFNLYPNNHILVMPLYDIEYKNRYKWLKK